MLPASSLNAASVRSMQMPFEKQNGIFREKIFEKKTFKSMRCNFELSKTGGKYVVALKLMAKNIGYK